MFKKLFVTLVLLVSLTFSMAGGIIPANAAQSPASDIDEEVSFELHAPDAIDRFVDRLYRLVLDRPPEPAGFQEWTRVLRDGSATGTHIAHGFFFSREMGIRNLPNDQFVETLYLTMLDRPSEPAGKTEWVRRLNEGYLREYVFAGFANSIEFGRLCEAAGIDQGSYTPPPGSAIRAFVTRLYRLALDREPEISGLTGWTDALLTGSTGAHVAHGFVFSREMELRNLPNDRFVETLYLTLLDRAPGNDPGRAVWVQRLYEGYTREYVFAGFVNSIEFGRLCRDAGIVQGSYSPPGGGTPQLNAGPETLLGKVIFLDPGHGTVGSPGVAGYNEAVTMLDLAQRIRPLLEELGATVIMTRNDEVNIPLVSRCAQINIRALEAVRSTHSNIPDQVEIDRLIGLMRGIINDPDGEGSRLMNTPFNASRTIHPDLQRVFEFQNNPVIRDNFLVISLHSNATATGSTTVRGAEAYFISPSEHANTRTYYTGFSFTSESRSFGDIILNHINNTGIPRRSLGLRAENYMIIREVNVPAVLVENGFHTNPADRALLQDSGFLDNLAVAYRNAVIQYFS
jgi:N-acetylmuramoyl-L-alanine amidase